MLTGVVSFGVLWWGEASMARSSVGTSKLPFLSPTVCGQAPFAHVTMILADGSEE